jgi:hypothetical protein
VEWSGVEKCGVRGDGIEGARKTRKVVEFCERAWALGLSWGQSALNVVPLIAGDVQCHVAMQPLPPSTCGVYFSTPC